MKHKKYENIQLIIKDKIKKHHKEFNEEALRICDKYSPFNGSGWLDKLSKHLLDSYMKSLNELLQTLKDIIISGYSKDEADAIKAFINTKYVEAINITMSTSPYRSLINSDTGKYHIEKILIYLQEDVLSTLDSTFALWKENMKINKRKGWKEFFNSILRLIKLGI